ELVTREELQKKLWPADTFVDFDRSLNAAMKRLRAALGDSAEAPRFIETLARRGYRFIAPVDARPSPVIEPPAPTPPPSSAPPSSARRPRPRYILPAALAVTAIFALGIMFYLDKSVDVVDRDRLPKRIESLLVLPLKSLSGDAEQGYFADAM